MTPRYDASDVAHSPMMQTKAVGVEVADHPTDLVLLEPQHLPLGREITTGAPWPAA